MNIHEEMKLHKWAQDMAEQKASGLSQKKWCKMKGIPTTTFQYRCRKVHLVMEEKLQESQPEHTAIVPAETIAETPAESEPFFAKVNLSPSHGVPSGMNIQFHDTLVHIAPDAPERHIRIVLEVLGHAQ